MPRTKRDGKKLPDFGTMTLEEIADFWESHDSADYWDRMEDVTSGVLFKPRTDRVVSVRIAADDLAALKQLASKQGLGHTTLIRTWIREKLRTEERA